MIDAAAPAALDPELGAQLQPFDEHNRELLANTHPGDWANPEPAGRYHLVVVGGGTAGLVSAAGAAGLGAKVALVERRLLGGDCLNYGCVPSKGVIRAARAWHEARRAHADFGGPATAGGGDFGAAMARMRRLRAHISHHDSAGRFRELGVDVFLGEARFVASDAVDVAGRRLRFRRAVVASGARPTAPPVPGLAEAGFYTNETVFTLTELPGRLAVVGGGPIGCELAQSFARFGSQVTVFDILPQLLPREDADAAALVRQAMESDGVRFELGVRLTRVERRAAGAAIRFERAGETRDLEVDTILVAAGRAPNVEGLGLEAAGVAFDRQGVRVDDRLRTTNPRVYAVGDVATPYRFTHIADAMARIAIQNALFYGRARASALVIPWCTYTSPEVAHVGLYEADAKAAGHEVETITVPLAGVDRALLDGDAAGFLRVHVKKGTDRLLGATVVAEHAGEMIGELALAATHGVGLGKISATIHPYPTQAEVIRRAGDAWRRGKLTPAVKRLFGLWFRLQS